MPLDHYDGIGRETQGLEQAATKRLQAEGIATRSGKLFDKSAVYRILNNQVYRGLAVHKGAVFPGEHKAIVTQESWDRTRAILSVSPRTRTGNTRSKTPALLKGILFGADGSRMTPTHTRKGGKLYRYYVSQGELKDGASNCPWRRVSAEQIEAAVVSHLRYMFREPEFVAGTWIAARETHPELGEDDVRSKLHQFDDVWDRLFPDQKSRLLQLVVERVMVFEAELKIYCRKDLPAALWEIGRADPPPPEWDLL